MANIATLLVNVGVKLDGALKVEQKIKRLRRTTKALGRDGAVATTRFGRAFQRMSRVVRTAAARARAAVGRLWDRIGGAKGLALAGGVAAAGIYKLVDSQTAAMDRTNKLSRALGIGVEELQRLQFAASQSGVGAEQLSLGMRTLNKNLLDISQGAGAEAKRGFDELGLSLADLDGLSRTQQLGLIGDRLNKIGDDAKRAALAGQIFGTRAGPQLATLLAEGSAGIARLAAQTQGVFSQADADRATAFQDRLGEVRNQVEALVRGLAVNLLPTIEDLIVRLQDWLAANDELIAQKLEDAIHAVIEAASTLYGILETVTEVMRALGIDTNTAEVAFIALASAAAASIHPMAALIPVTMKLGAELAKIAVLGGQAVGTISGIADLTATNVQNAALAGEASAKKEAAVLAFKKEWGWGGTGKRSGSAAPSGGGGRRRGGGGGGGGGGRSRRGRGPGPLSSLFSEGNELVQDALYRMATGLPRRGGVTVDEAIEALLAGRGGGHPMIERLSQLADRSPATKDVKPQVAMDITINQNFQNQQRIVSPEPGDAAKRSAEAIRNVLREETAKAGQAIAGNVLR